MKINPDSWIPLNPLTLLFEKNSGLLDENQLTESLVWESIPTSIRRPSRRHSVRNPSQSITLSQVVPSAAVANSTAATFLRVVGSELIQKYLGDGPKLVRELFRVADDLSPSIVFIDEIDAIGTKSLDPALLRPGRIDRKIEFPLPDIKTRRRIFQIHTSRMTLADDVNLEEFVMTKDEFSGADIKAICTEALL
ncbi:hypothetical protein TEA_000494 [Camellia sinensis var. sinensis]|uniref:ATPase AAA-type core domain-containing protein n=1 Tax=Camellia sinensis var. sinensis TaxID=542762 RepID=A0A4S4DEX5_CAMSN|nr:hypothetical protein TEA_000494 [Camellia sinensis var. sinensis]